MANPSNRIVVLIDMDCFFCQVETKLQPEHEGKPLAVVQYNQWEMGGIIAVNYEARNFGVTRHMRGKEAKEKCPGLVLVSVPCLRGKADTSRYRRAGREVIEVIRKHCNIIERASVDEAYLDITDIVDKRLLTTKMSPKELVSFLINTYVVGYSEVGKNNEEERHQGINTWILDSFQEIDDMQSHRLALAGTIVEEIRASIYKETGFRCSAGIAQNKILAKLACGLHKPNRQTILPEAAISSLYSTLPVKKVRNLGGKFGDVVVDSLGCNVMGGLLQYSLEQLQKHFDEKTGLWLYNIARGIDNEPVINRLLSKSIGACKKFPGKQAITSLEVLKHWAGDLAAEVCERLEQDLEENQRRAKLLTISYHYYQNRNTICQSRSLTLNSYKPEKVARQCVDVITKSTQRPIAYLGISASKFVPSKESGTFLKFFKITKLEDNGKIDGKADPEIEILKVVDSTRSVITTKLNLEAEEENHLVIASEEDTFLQKEDVIPSVVISKEDNFQDVESVVNKASIVINNEATVKESKKSINRSLNTNAEDSPTSKRLFKLIQVCNEHGEARSKNKRMSNLTINNNDFQDSFFMNIYKTGRKELSENIDTTDETEYCKELSFTTSFKNGNTVDRFTDETDVSCQNTVQNIDYNIDNCNSDSCRQKNEESSSCSYSCISNNEDIINKPDEKTSMSHSSVQLREIFPNMDDIDPDVLLLLPIDLQKEARMYLKSQEKKQENIKITRDVSKTSKGKSSKSKTTSKNKKRSPLYNFLIKTDSNTHDVPFKRCAECNQMILITKYNEHMDFHVAQNLYEEINKPKSNENNIKKKLETTKTVFTSVKHQPNICKIDKNSESMTFLS